MSLVKVDLRCAFCHTPLTTWSASTCVRCGKKLCAHHAHCIRMHHSYVLASVCEECREQSRYTYSKKPWSLSSRS
jgi:RNase P subunit RPR2